MRWLLFLDESGEGRVAGIGRFRPRPEEVTMNALSGVDLRSTPAIYENSVVKPSWMSLWWEHEFGSGRWAAMLLAQPAQFWGNWSDYPAKRKPRSTEAMNQ